MPLLTGTALAPQYSDPAPAAFRFHASNNPQEKPMVTAQCKVLFRCKNRSNERNTAPSLERTTGCFVKIVWCQIKTDIMKTNTAKLLILLAACCTSCNQRTQTAPPQQADVMNLRTTSLYSKPISKDTGNRMIQSYLTSIHPQINEYELKSLIFDATLLRNYLNDTSNGRIAQLKMVLAHRLSYINSGHFGQRPDSNSEALTLVLVGYGQNGNYIYYNENQVLNVCQPCPRACPDAGTAASDLLD